MRTAETLFFTAPHPDYVFSEGARVAPNQEGFPAGAIIYVETDSNFLEFGIEREGPDETGFVISLVDCFPPLPEIDARQALIVDGAMLKKGQEFTLVSAGSSLARHVFKSLKIVSNIERTAISPSEGQG
jgi:hypothetical protein